MTIRQTQPSATRAPKAASLAYGGDEGRLDCVASELGVAADRARDARVVLEVGAVEILELRPRRALAPHIYKSLTAAELV
jgi:hypothetical protein